MFLIQWYISRELLKTFALTAIGLTLIFSLCGGALQMMQAEALTAVQLAKMLAFVLPVATTLTLPIAALFACAMVYGRLASDNEIDACKSSGINIQRLLLPAFALSIFTAGFTFLFSNYVIPAYIKQLDNMVRRDMHKLAVHALNTTGYIRQGSPERGMHLVYAGNSDTIKQGNNEETVYIQNALYMEIENENLIRVGTADQVRADFYTQEKGAPPIVQVCAYNVFGVDIEHNQLIVMARQPFDPMSVPSMVEQKPKWLNLNELFYYREHPAELGDVRNKADNLRLLVLDELFYKWVIEELTGPTHVCKLADADTKYVIRCQSIDIKYIPGTKEIDSYKPKLIQPVIEAESNGKKITYKAEQCTFKINHGYGDLPTTVHMTLEGDVTFTDPYNPSNVVRSRRQDLPNVNMPERFNEQVEAISDAELFGKDQPLDSELKPLQAKVGSELESLRTRMRRGLIKQTLEINSIIHSRLAFSVSVLVMLVLSAGLGIIYRGGQMLTAFVIAFLPGMFTVVMNIMGRQLAENSGTAMIGISVIWGGIALLAVLDGLVLTKFLRR